MDDPIWQRELREANHLPPVHPQRGQELQNEALGGYTPAKDPPVFAPAAPEPVPMWGSREPVSPVERLPHAQVDLGGDLLLNLIFVGILWEVWVCLYPLSTVAGLYTLANGTPFLRGVLPDSPIIGPGLYAVVLGIAVAVVVLWTVSRLEHRLARNGAYRILRHLVRIPVLGVAMVVAIEKWKGLPDDTTLAGIRRILETGVNLAIVVGVMIAVHFILWNWKQAREFWHRRLEGARLRQREA